jgi:polar amino acid transport system substrate-binding protein
VIPRLLRLLCALALIGTAAACSSRTETKCAGSDVRLVSSGKLTVAADYSYPPFAFRSRDNDLIGFDVDVAKVIAKELKLDATFVNRGAGAQIPGLIAHRHDIAISGLRVTPTVRDEACATEPYLDAGLGVLVWETNPQEIASIDDLDGMKVAVLDDSAAEDWALDHLDGVALTALAATDDLLSALQKGEVDAVIADLPFVRFSAKESPAFRHAATADTGGNYVIVGAEDNGPLVAGIDEAIERLRKNGTLRKLEEKWFGGAPETSKPTD